MTMALVYPEGVARAPGHRHGPSPGPEGPPSCRDQLRAWPDDVCSALPDLAVLLLPGAIAEGERPDGQRVAHQRVVDPGEEISPP